MKNASEHTVRSAIDIASLDVMLDGAEVLRGVELSAAAGEWVNIIGPNGAGKTTLLRALLGLVPSRGEIRIADLDDGRRSARARKMAYVPQSPVIPPGMLVADYVLLGRTPHRGMFGAETADDIRIVTEVLERLDLGGFGGRAVGSLSGGERQRAVMARALAQQTDILLLDEPTTALDLGHQQDVMELVDALRHERGLTVIATLHDLTLAARYGDRIAILADGRIVESGRPADVVTVENIANHFGAHVRIIDDPGGPVIVPTSGTSRVLTGAETAIQDAAIQNAADGDAAIQRAAVQGGAIQEAAADNPAVQNAPIRNASIENASLFRDEYQSENGDLL